MLPLLEDAMVFTFLVAGVRGERHYGAWTMCTHVSSRSFNSIAAVSRTSSWAFSGVLKDTHRGIISDTRARIYLSELQTIGKMMMQVMPMATKHQSGEAGNSSISAASQRKCVLKWRVLSES